MKRKLLTFLFQHVFSIRPLVKTELRSQLLRSLGARVGQKVYFAPRCRIVNPAYFAVGDDTSLGQDVLIDGWARVGIGNHIIVANDVQLLTGGHDLHNPKFPAKHRDIQIGDYAWIAAHSLVLGGVKIGRGAVVGAGSVVREDVPELAIVLGNPAKVVGQRRCSTFEYSPGRFFRDGLPSM